MVYSKSGKYGIQNNEESVTYRGYNPIETSNPTLTATPSC